MPAAGQSATLQRANNDNSGQYKLAFIHAVLWKGKTIEHSDWVGHDVMKRKIANWDAKIFLTQ